MVMKLTPYLCIARPDHWFKNVFILPGILLALFFDPQLLSGLVLLRILFGLICVCLIASSNYVLNEILDAASDRHHPIKHRRPIPSGQINIVAAYCLWSALAIFGIGGAFLINPAFGYSGLVLWVMGVLYNAPPIRLKDLPYADVLSESLNNPIRLALGWYVTGMGSAPPLSMFVAYWMFGAFLMAAKRLAEFRMIDDARRAASYRKSFLRYTEASLLESIFFYGTFFALMSGYFIARYRFELVLATPLVALAMAYYLHLACKSDSAAQYPERLYREKKLVLIVLAAFLACVILLFVDLPDFTKFFTPWILPQRTLW
jgi:4-hydroxybenzoate polyprenyltransferase